MNHKSQGLFYKKLDLHIHSPASTDFAGEIDPEDIVEEAFRKNLDGIAITDHNSGNWIDKIKEAATEKNLTIIPGVEITCMGGKRNIHLIALFEIDKDTEYVNSVLSALGIKPEERGKQETLVQKTLLEVITIIQNEWEGLVILAHVNSDSGVLSDMKGQQRTEVIKFPGLLGVEATDFQNQEKEKNRKRVVDLLDGTDPIYKRKLAVYQASDNPNEGGGHGLIGIGTRCAYFKLEEINLNGLRQCLADPDVRILQDFQYQTWEYPRIQEMRISGGFLGGETATFHGGLNSILGGKGTGKSLLIEFLRFCLNQPPDDLDILDDYNGKLNSRLGEYEYIEVDILDETGKSVTLKRTLNPLEGNPYEKAGYDPAQVFPILFLSQNEIIKIAEDETQQLSFIDRFFDFRTYKQKISSIEDQLSVLDRRMAENLGSFPIVRDLKEQIKTKEIDLERLDKALKNPAFQKFKEFEEKNIALNSQSQFVKSLRLTSQQAETRVQNLDIPAIPKNLSKDPALRRNFDTLTQIKQELESKLDKVEASISAIEEKVSQEINIWAPSMKQAKEEYENHIQKSGGDYRTLAMQRAKRVKELEEIRSRLDQETKKKVTVTEISKQRHEFLDTLEEVYKNYTKERREKSAKFQKDSAGRLQLRIIESSNSEVFRSKLLELKRGSYLKDAEIETICSNVKPRDFILALLRFAVTEGQQPKHLKDVAKEAQIELGRLSTLAKFLLEEIDYEELLALQYKATLQDRPEILYNVGDEEFRPLNAVSVGQKSIALLIMALSDGTMPVVIDQPEDSLDIRSIWEDVCLKIRKGKERRQFISTTHSSSVAVASDTDKFIILEGTSKKGSVLYSGSMDNTPVSDEVLKYLEGGIEAYKMKHIKYQAEKKIGT